MNNTFSDGTTAEQVAEEAGFVYTQVDYEYEDYINLNEISEHNPMLDEIIFS